MAVLAATIFVYWPGLRGGLMLDDYENLRTLTSLNEGKDPWTSLLWSSSGPFGRPLAMATFIANMAFSGPDVWAFKLTNLVIHLACGLMVFVLAGHLLRALRPTEPRETRWALALLVGALWLLAPLLVSTTLYLIQRMTQLSALFSFAGLLSYVLGREHLDDRPIRGWIFVGASLLLWLPLATLSKENGILLPLLLLVVEVFAFRFSASSANRAALYTLFTITVGLPALIGIGVMLFDSQFITAGYADRPFSFSGRLLTEPRVLCFYVTNLLFPQGGRLGLFHDDFVISKSFFDPFDTAIATAIWLLVVVLAVIARRRAWWPLLLGPCFFLAGHILESTVFPLELVFEHRNYLPSFGLFLMEVLGLSMLLEYRQLRRPLLIFMYALPLVYAGATLERTNIWSSWETILLSSKKAHPDSPRVHIELASFYSQSGQVDKALRELNDVERLRPDSASGVALHRLIVYCVGKQPVPDSVYSQIPRTMADSDAGIYTINTLRGITRSIYTDQCPGDININRLLPALEQWADKAGPAANGSRLWNLHYEVAQLARFEGNFRTAISHLRAAYQLAPERPESLLVMARYQIEAGDTNGASTTLNIVAPLIAHTKLGESAFSDEYRRLQHVVTAQEHPRANKRSTSGL